MRKLVLRFVNEETGATAIEYGLIAAGISIAIITVVIHAWHTTQQHVQQRLQRAQITSACSWQPETDVG